MQVTLCRFSCSEDQYVLILSCLKIRFFWNSFEFSPILKSWKMPDSLLASLHVAMQVLSMEMSFLHSVQQQHFLICFVKCYLICFVSSIVVFTWKEHSSCICFLKILVFSYSFIACISRCVTWVRYWQRLSSVCVCKFIWECENDCALPDDSSVEAVCLSFIIWRACLLEHTHLHSYSAPGGQKWEETFHYSVKSTNTCRIQFNVRMYRKTSSA